VIARNSHPHLFIHRRRLFRFSVRTIAHFDFKSLSNHIYCQQSTQQD